jgi:prepilin-type N-terminal cleavage/methylation domain-containing protein
MDSFLPRGRLDDEAGFTLVELLVTCLLLGIILMGLSNVLISGERASSDATARMTSQQNVNLAFDRLEFDARCASQATLQSSGAGVYLTLPNQCAHASGNITWCVNSGSLVRIVGTSCATAGQTYITNVTSATPFSCYAPTGTGSDPKPQLDVSLVVNSTTKTGNGTSATDQITMRNANPGACS